MGGWPGAILALAAEVVAIYAFGALAWHWPPPGSDERLRWALAVAAGLVAAVLWGRFAAPKTRRRLRGGMLFLFKAAFLGSSVAAFAVRHSSGAALVFAIAVGLHLLLLLAFRDVE